MSKQIKYKNAPKEVADSIIRSSIIDDFLPPPEELVFMEESERITLNLSKSSLEFFRKKATELGIPYQRMIKRIVDMYARKFEAAND